MEEIRRLAAAVGLPDFQYYVIPAAVSKFALEVADPLLPGSVLAVVADEELETEVAAVSLPEPQRVGLSIVRSVASFVSPIASARPARSFSLLAEVAAAVASAHSMQRPIALDTAACEALNPMPRRAQSGGRPAVAVVGRR